MLYINPIHIVSLSNIKLNQPIDRSGHHSAGARFSVQSDEALDIARRHSEAAAHDGSSDVKMKVTPGLPHSVSPFETPRNLPGMTGPSTNAFDFRYAVGSFASSSFPVRPPRTPPPTPLRTPGDGFNETETLTDFGSYFNVCNGRRFVFGLPYCHPRIPTNYATARFHSKSTRY